MVSFCLIIRTRVPRVLGHTPHFWTCSMKPCSVSSSSCFLYSLTTVFSLFFLHVFQITPRLHYSPSLLLSKSSFTQLKNFTYFCPSLPGRSVLFIVLLSLDVSKTRSLRRNGPNRFKDPLLLLSLLSTPSSQSNSDGESPVTHGYVVPVT